MFEDSLVESQDRIRTKSRWFAIGSFFAQAGLLLLLILYPLFHPLGLPRQSIERLLIAPPPPRAPAPIEVHHATAPCFGTLFTEFAGATASADNHSYPHCQRSRRRSAANFSRDTRRRSHRSARRNSSRPRIASGGNGQTASAEASSDHLFRSRHRPAHQPYPANLSRNCESGPNPGHSDYRGHHLPPGDNRELAGNGGPANAAAGSHRRGRSGPLSAVSVERRTGRSPDQHPRHLFAWRIEQRAFR